MTSYTESARDWREFAIDLAQRAGATLLAIRQDGLAEEQVRTKGTLSDVVTDADLAVQRLIVGTIQARFPAHQIVAEEGSDEEEGVGAGWAWLVDPLDGTTNYAHGLPLFAINLTLVRDGIPVLGVTHDPSAARTYWAEAGGGAWLRTGGRNQPLHVSATAEFSRCLLATGFPYDRATNPDNNVAEFAALDSQVQAVRRLGSAALALAWVAAGVLDGFWEARLMPWDWAAGWLLVREAGGEVTDYQGRPLTLASHTLVASNGQPAIHRALLEGIAAARAAAGLNKRQ